MRNAPSGTQETFESCPRGAKPGRHLLYSHMSQSHNELLIVFFPLRTERDVSDIMTPTGRMKGKLRQELPQPKQETQDGAGNRKRLFPFRADSYPALLIGYSPFPTFKAGSCLIESVLE